MPRMVAFLHTVPSLVDPFQRLAKELLPGDVEPVHIVDGMALKIVLDQGGLSPFIHRRVAEHAIAAEEAGAIALQCTCSSISPCVDTARLVVSIPTLKVDEPMVEQAIATGRRIGVAATAPTTLKPTTELVYARAAQLGKQVEVDPMLGQAAYAAMFAGDLATHDRIVLDMLRQLMERNDVVVLAQASMARLAEMIPTAERRVPILSSPRLAVERLRDIIAVL